MTRTSSEGGEATDDHAHNQTPLSDRDYIDELRDRMSENATFLKECRIAVEGPERLKSSRPAATLPDSASLPRLPTYWPMSSFLSHDAKISVESFPYRHLVIENCFCNDIADELLECFRQSISKAVPIGKVGEVGELHYSAINYTPDMTDLVSSAVSVFATDEMRQLICGVLGADSNECFMLGSHRHEPPSNNGWPHTDCAIVSYPRKGPQFNGFNIFQPDSGCIYADDTRDRQPSSLKVARAVACIYYLGNREWQEGDGGETAMYATDRKTIVKRVPPLHNSLFAFEISPVSYHGYLAAPRDKRDSYIWWYHADISRVMSRHKASFLQRSAGGEDAWDRWTNASEAKYVVPDGSPLQ